LKSPDRWERPSNNPAIKAKKSLDYYPARRKVPHMSIATLESTLIEAALGTDETQIPEPIRVIRNGQWVILKSEAELTEAECRAIFVAAFGIYA
jgi:hypothetical protein